MLTRCPGCGKEIEETLDICPHCKRDFTVAVQGSGRRVGSLDSSPMAKEPAVKPPAKPAEKPPAKPAPKPPPKPAASGDPRAKKAAPEQPPPPKQPPPKDDLDDLPPHMKADLEAPPAGDNLDDLPAHMRAEIEAPPKDSLDDLPPHMRADIEAPPKSDSMDESVLPPHMRSDAFDSFTPSARQEKKVNPILYVVIAAVFVGGFIFSRVTAKKAPPPAEPKTTETPPLPDASAEDTGQKEKTEDESAKMKEMEKASLSFDDSAAPPSIEDSGAPVIEEPKKTPAKGKPRRREAPAVIPAGDNLGARAAAPKHEKWRFRAKVLNMWTLAPAAGVKVSLYDNSTSQRYPTETGESGEFRKTVPASSSGYKLVLQHKDYEARFLPGSAHNFQSMSENERKEVGKKLKQFSKELPPVYADSKGYVQETYYLLPREKHGMSLQDALDR